MRNRHSSPISRSSIRTTTCGMTSAAVISSMSSSMTFRPDTTSLRPSTPSSRRCIARRDRRRCGRWGSRIRQWHRCWSASGRYGKVRLCEGIIGYADLLLGDDVQPVLEALIAAGNGRFRGIRYGATWDSGSAGYGRTFAPPHLMLDAKFRRGFARLGPLGLSFDAWLFYPQLPDLIDLLQAFPDTEVILDHAGGILGIPPHIQRDEVFSIWRSHIRRLARFPNLSVKIGGFGMLYCGWDFHVRDIPPSSAELSSAWRPYVETCIEAFGSERCMFESNFPVDKQSCGYGVLWNAFKRVTQGCSTAQKAALYHDTAARVYRLAR